MANKVKESTAKEEYTRLKKAFDNLIKAKGTGFSLN